MAKIVGLPKLSPTMEVGTLVRWVKRKGERVEVDDLLAEVETDKATMEFRSFDRGVLLEVLAPEGATLRPETPVAILGEPGEDVAPLLATLRPMGPHPSHAEPTPVVAGGNVGPAGHAVAAQGMAKTASPVEAAAPAGDAGGAARVPASPLVRRLARERGVDLRVIAGSGPRGRVVLRDLEAYLREVARGPSAPVPEAARSTAVGQATADRVVPVGSMRRTIARRLTEAKRDVPHYYLTIDVDAGPLVELRAQINAALVESGEKVTLTDLLVRACALALSRHRRLNASFEGERIVEHGRIDVAVAVALPDGLVTPVVRDADRKRVAEIARETRSLAERARERRLGPDEMSGATFTISNLGMYGIESFTAVIDPPQAAILAVGAVRDEPVVRAGTVVAGRRMRMTLSCDHRAVDGAVGAQFLTALREFVEHPVRLLL